MGQACVMLAAAEARNETFGRRLKCAACITYAWRAGGLNARGQKNFHTQLFQIT